MQTSLLDEVKSEVAERSKNEKIRIDLVCEAASRGLFLRFLAIAGDVGKLGRVR